MSEIDRRMLLGAAAGVAGVAAFSRRARGGPLDPPQGSVTSTGRTLIQVEPRVPLSQEHTPGDATSTFRIRSAGSYCLTSDLVGESGKVAIKVELPSPGVVQIDMNGFTMRRGASEFVTAMMFTGAQCRCLCVADGYLVGWGLDCFNVAFADIDDLAVLGAEVGLRVRMSACIFDVEITACTASGIEWLRDPTASSLSLEVSDCVVRDCGTDGLSVSGDWSGATAALSVDDSDFISCGRDGLSVQASSGGGGGGGRIVVSVSDVCCPNCRNGIVINNTPLPPGALGVEHVVTITAVDCVGNRECGMQCSNVTLDIEGCVCTHNGQDGMRLENCPGCVCDCTAGWNHERGISISGFNPVTSTTAMSECTDCTCVNNAIGIFADGSVTGVCFEDNSLVNNSQTGMQIDGTGNLVVSNACRGAISPLPGFMIAPGNMAGAVVSGPDALIVSDNPNLNCVL